MAQSLITFAVALASFSSFASAADTCKSFGVDFQEGGVYFQNNASSDPFTAFQYFSGCTNDTSNNVLVDPQGNQAQCSNTNMQPDKQTQLITCSDNPKDTLYNGNWSLLVISNNGNADPIAYQRDFSLDVGSQSTTYVYPTVTVDPSSTTVETSTKQTETTITSRVPKTTITATHTISSLVSSQTHGWTEHPHPSYVKTTKVMHTYTQTLTEWRISASFHAVEAQCTAPTAPGYEDKIANIVPSILGELDNVAKKVVEGVEDTVDKTVGGVLGGLGLRDENSASAMYKRAIIEGRQPTEEEKRGFVAEREARMARRVVNLQKRHPDNRTVTSTATQIVTATGHAINMTTLTDFITNTDSTTTTVSQGTATVFANQTVPVTTTAPVPTFTWTVYQPFAVETTTVWSTYAITNTYTTTAFGAQASCAHQNKFMH
ncbi:hypothetical protein M409DRAFT_60889 [Zasmidium cellare ATCC 36951]|uniref:Uncharacterized protein n=1 Tax=Zasmidium cellare ATCC 36951 TaxID=1080233 RepID=A0A6A6BXH8_ZASCE|nr:uncharacterized protein M409DRAFT_60889 [Zasmidium cellare ATCC 36951]KAF2159303.1 hypothetical protein M409DRAFT_60889 [Zasmidium cellare ATCC 36951]